MFRLKGQARFLIGLAAFSPFLLALFYWLDILGVIPDYRPWARAIGIIILVAPAIAAKAILIYKNES